MAKNLRGGRNSGRTAALEKHVQDVIRAWRQQEQAARRARQQWEEVRKMLPDAERRPFELLARLGSLPTVTPEQADTVKTLRTWAEEKAQEQRARYTEQLRAALPADDINGQLTEGYWIRRMIRVEIDDQKYRATVGTRFNSRRLTGDISVDAVAEAVRVELQRLFDRPFDPEQFLGDLFRAYELALTSEGRPGRHGEPVSIFTVHKFLVFSRQSDRTFHSVQPSHFRPYLPDEFAVDLGRLLEAGSTRLDGLSLHLHPVRNPKEALFVVNFATGTGQNYGLLSFMPS